MSPYTPFTAGETDPDKPILSSWGVDVMNNLDFFNSLLGTLDAMDVRNGSFEIDADSDGIPDGWTRNLYSGGSSAIITAPTNAHGAKAFQFTQPSGASQGGGDLTSDYIPVNRYSGIPLTFQCGTSNGTVIAKVIIQCFDETKAAAGSDQTIWTSSGTESIDRLRVAYFVPNAGTHFVKIKLVGGEVGPNTSATVVFDNVTIRAHLRRLEVETGTISEQNTTNTGFTTVGSGITLGLGQKLYNAHLVIVLAAELKSSTDTGDVWMRWEINGTYSNEMLVSDSKYATGFFFIRYDPAGEDGLTLNMQLKASSTITAYGQKLFAPVLVFMEDVV